MQVISETPVQFWMFLPMTIITERDIAIEKDHKKRMMTAMIVRAT
jgi:hypothetical protein